MKAISAPVSAYLIALGCYLLGWFLLMCGLAATQHYCDEHLNFFTPFFLNPVMLAVDAGSSCHKLFRFPWWAWAFGLLPVVADALEMVKPSGRRFGTGAGLYGGVAVLYMVFANVFYNLKETIDGPTAMESRIKTALAGWAITAAFAMLLILLAPLVRGREDAAVAVTTEGGLKADAPKSGEAAAMV